jgi:hypothetical protein
VEVVGIVEVVGVVGVVEVVVAVAVVEVAEVVKAIAVATALLGLNPTGKYNAPFTQAYCLA